MAQRNTTCKICNKKFHTCSSCGLDGWEWDFCSIECFQHFKNQHKEKLKDTFSYIFKNIEISKELFNLLNDQTDMDGYKRDIFSEVLQESYEKENK